MKLLLLCTVKDCFGITDVTVLVNNKKEYTFSLKSEYDVEVFNEKLRFHPGKALNYLKKCSIKH